MPVLACILQSRKPMFSACRGQLSDSEKNVSDLQRRFRTVVCDGLLMVALMLAATAATAEDQRLGVASCASSICHGATRPLGEHPIRQDEYFIWQQQDRHSRAYRTLSNASSRKIGLALGINPSSAPSCLACHADPAATAARGPRYLLADGVGCESCHGAAERWLPEHKRADITLVQKVALGMQPLWQAETRAALCLGCHQGDAAHPISHAMMAAGHPRLVFELDSFTALQPAHHQHDADYAARKGAYQPARDWLIGQVSAAELHLQALAAGRFISHGLMPEWMQFDCTACHHGMDAARWQANRMPGAEPGAVPFADAPAQLLALWLTVVAPEEALAWREGQQRLNAAQARGADAVRVAAQQQLVALQSRVRPLISAAPMSMMQLRGLLRALVSDRSQAPLGSEQRAMALTVLTDALRLQGAPISATANQAIEAYYKTVRSVDRFDAKDHARALDAVARALP